MMIYHRNRLIRPYHRVGLQLEANNKGIGVLGVVQADYLEPTHNKQVRTNPAAPQKTIAPTNHPPPPVAAMLVSRLVMLFCMYCVCVGGYTDEKGC
jgi:hypothetical protein